jgi:hypothetical protein
MAASHQHLFQSSVIDDSEIHKLVANHFVPDRAVLQWCPTLGEDLPTPSTNDIVVFSSFQHRFGLPAYDFFHELLDHYQIKLVHLNPNSILQIAVFVHLCQAFLGIPPNFPLFKNYFFLKYQPSAPNLPLKTSLRGSHRTWFYYVNHEPSLPHFVSQLLEFQGTWSEEPTPLKLPQVAALINKINLLKEQGLTGVCMAAHWLAHEVLPLTK